MSNTTKDQVIEWLSSQPVIELAALVKDLEGGFVNVLPLVIGRIVQQRRTLLEKQRMELELA